MDIIEKKIINIIEERKQNIIEIGRKIWDYPELGYKEFKTSSMFIRHLEDLGITVEKDLAITGVKGYLKDKKQPGKTIALLGELDALPLRDSPHANIETGAAHCCGHNAQMAGVMGAAFALCDDEIKEALDGNVVFFATPAEEFVEVEFKNKLMKESKISYGGGKCELIRIGAFDDIDIAVSHHISTKIDMAVSNHKSNGFLNKIVHYKGVSSHAAEAPYNGVDALNALTIATTAINFQRESFRDSDTVRIHGFISKGGEAMNVIADNTTMEYSVRANNIGAILDANNKFNRSIRAGAVATGCEGEIITMPGYLPVVPVKDTKAIEESLILAAGDYKISGEDPNCISGGSTDCGDVSQLMPLLMFNTGGYNKDLHDKDMEPVDEYLAYVVTAKVFALTAYKLLKNKGEYAEAIIESYKQLLTKEQYIKYMEEQNTIERIPMKIERIM